MRVSATPDVPLTITLFGPMRVLVNGQPLPQEHGFPVRLVVPGLYGFCSATKWITDIELTTLGAFTPYWVHRGWTQVSPIKTESRIDTPKAGGSLQAGKVMIAGVAWAQHKGIEQVEVQVDGGQWTKATLAVQDEVDTWRQWYVPWQATAGHHPDDSYGVREQDHVPQRRDRLPHRAGHRRLTGRVSGTIIDRTGGQPGAGGPSGTGPGQMSSTGHGA